MVARFDGDDLTKSTIGRIKDDGNDKVTYVLDGKVLMGVCITEVKGTDAPVAYTVKVDNATNVDYTITDENNNSKTNESLVLTEKNLDVTVKMTPKTGYQWTDNKGTETRTVTLTKVTEDKTVTADNVQAVAATQATLTLNLTDAVVTVNGTSYVNGQTVTVPVDTTLAVVPTGTDANKTVATVSVSGEGNTVTKAGTTYYVRALVDGTLTVSYDYQSYDLTLNAPAGWEFTSEIPAQIKTGMDWFTVTMQQQTAAAQAAGKKIESDKTEVKVSGVTTEGVKAVAQTYVESDATGATSGVFDTFENFKAALEAGKLFTTTDSVTYTEVTSAADYQTGTTYYKIDVAGVSPKVATATVEVTIGNVTGDVTATLSIEA